MKKTGLWISPTSFVEIGAGRGSLSAELATRDRVNYLSLGQWLPNPDPVLKKMYKDLSVYREVASDAHIRGCVRNRKAGVMALQWGLDRGRSRSRQAKIIEDLFARLPMQRIIGEVLDAPQYGYALLEVIWERSGDMWLPRDILGKPQEWFVFDTENRLRMRTVANYMGELLPDRKFLVPRQEATYDNPYGYPDLSSCFWPATFKKGGLKFWVTFCEKYGMPFAVGKTPRGTDKAENDRLADSLEDMVRDAIAVIPDDSSVEIIEAAGKAASSAIYRDLLQFCKNEISIVQLGHEGAAQSTPGKLGNDDTAMSVRKDIVNADKRIVEEAFNTLIGWIWEMNFSGDRPVFSMWEDADTDEKNSTRDKTLTDCGVKFTKAHFVKEYGFDEDEFDVGAVPTSPPTPILPGEGGTFAEGATQRVARTDQRAIDDLIAGIPDADLQAQAEAVLAPIIVMFSEAKSYEEIMASLVAQFPKMNTDSLGDLVARARFVANIWGRLNGRQS